MAILFRIFLLASLLGISYVLIFRLRYLFFQRLVGVMIGLVICVFVLAPPLSTRFANFFGIARGADFVLYLAQFCWIYGVIRLYLNQQSMHAKLSTLTRSLALSTAEAPTSQKPN